MSKKLTAREEKEVCNLYKKGLSCYKISLKYPVSMGTILLCLKRNNIKRRTLSQAFRKYAVNEKVFNSFNPSSEYWGGFLIADGYVCIKKGRSHKLTLLLGKKDYNHLCKFKKFLQASYPIREEINKKTGRKYISIVISSDKIVNTLKKYGVIPRKTFTTSAPKQLENSRHFWRGVIDGDGCICFTKRGKYKYPRIELWGSESLMKQFSNYCSTILNKKVNVNKYQNSFYVHFTGLPAEKIIKKLYLNSNIYLDRKYKLAMKILNTPKTA